jgi:hypothetical protein
MFRFMWRITPVFTAICVLALSGALPAASDPVYLVGANVYSSASDGTTVGGHYCYSTNSSAFTQRLILGLNGVQQQNAVSFLLSPGDNQFTFDVNQSFDPGAFAGLSLLFNTSGVSYNPSGYSGVAGDLVVVGSTNNSSAFLFPSVGTSVRSYDDALNGPYTASYSGASTFLVGNEVATVTGFSVNAVPQGTFTITISSAVPEASGFLSTLLGFGLISVALLKRRRVHKWSHRN